MRNRRVLLLGGVGVVWVLAVMVDAHGGGIDSYGCHNDNRAKTYHCHQGPCAGKSFATQRAMLADACRKPPAPAPAKPAETPQQFSATSTSAHSASPVSLTATQSSSTASGPFA